VTEGGARARLERIFQAGVAAADPARALRREVRARADGSLSLAGEVLPAGTALHVLAVGKAAAVMAAAIEEIAGSRMAAGLAVTKPGHGRPLSRCELREAGHPVPDARSEHAGREALRFAAHVPPDAVLLVLLSGGASSLLATPAKGLELADLAATTRLLLASGAPIDEQNTVRKHLSAVSGGRLALETPARRVCVLALSDVSGDRFDVIGSGPCAPDPSRYRDALAVLEQRGVLGEVPEPVRGHLEAGVRGERPETPDAAEVAFSRVRHVLLASNRTALGGARAAAEREGFAAVVVSEELRGEARVAGARLAALVIATRSRAPAGALDRRRPSCLLAGGETTVTLRGGGRGGRSQELALAAALCLAGDPAAALLAAGSDGSDGPTDAAGAFVDGGTVERAREAGLDAKAALDANDSYPFFEREGGLLRTGPTGTNVRDLVVACAGG
jgi:glycerate-2-kinase